MATDSVRNLQGDKRNADGADYADSDFSRNPQETVGKARNQGYKIDRKRPVAFGVGHAGTICLDSNP